MHRSLMRAFPDDLKAGTERVLFRLEIQDRGAMPTLLVQSWTLPDWSWLGAEARGYLLPTSVPNPAIKSFDMQAASEQELAFRLRANPSVKRDGRRCGLYCYVCRDKGITHKLTLLAVQFDGLLQVTDPDHLRESVEGGIGSAKAFGLGLLSLAPLA
jgi:CRISPR system Cascade subunit CasE